MMLLYDTRVAAEYELKLQNLQGVGPSWSAAS